jgi:hypothetical protein
MTEETEPGPVAEHAPERGVVVDETAGGVRTIVLTDWRRFHERMVSREMLRPGLIWRGQKRRGLCDPG